MVGQAEAAALHTLHQHPADRPAQALVGHLIKTLAALIPAQAEVAALAAVEGALAEQETQIPTMAALAAMASLRQLPGRPLHMAAAVVVVDLRVAPAHQVGQEAGALAALATRLARLARPTPEAVAAGQAAPTQ